ncbi:MAG TPA: ATP-binding protein [Desulfobacterales bacterium]|nr:ATP-binding protein [Desulfobacterales bacterium]
MNVEIEREIYLDRLLRFVESPTCVAVVGLRRVGKSVLLRQLARRLAGRGRVVYVDKEDLAFDAILDARDLVGHVDAQRGSKAPTYVIVDEVQQVDGWERAVASLLGREQTRVVVSGSNSTLLAGELATRMAGRYSTMRVLPLSLGEFTRLHTRARHGNAAPADLFRMYREIGGLPGLLHTDLSPDLVQQMLRDIYSTIALRDIVQRRAIRDIDTFESIVRFTMDNVGSLVSAKRIADFMKAQRRSGSVDTVLNHLAWLCEAFVFDRVDRYDLHGKRHLQVNSKYFLGDLGLRRGLLGVQERWIAGDLENLVYHELLRRGYRVSIGVHQAQEIDFVAERSPGRVYVQVAYLLPSRKTLDRERSALLAPVDAYPRAIVSLDPVAPGGLEGIAHLNAIEFLCGAKLPGES